MSAKLERCPHCGKWALVRRASAEDLSEAEARLRAEGEPEERPAELSEAEKMKKMLDDSQYDN